YRDLLDAGEYVQFGQHEVGERVHARGVAGDDRVVPPGAPRAAGGDAEFPADAAQALSPLVVELGGERPLADTGGVGLDDPDDAVDARGADPGASACTGGDRRGGGDERVGAMVDVEHGGLAGF